MVSLLPMDCLSPLTDSQTRVKCTLELLPAELRIAILFHCPDLDSILALAHASPLFYHAYRHFREDLLTYALYAEYDGIVDITDSIVALRSRNLHASVPANSDKIYSLLDQWRRHGEIRSLDLASASDLPDRPINFDEVLRLLRLHKIMKFCLDGFCSSMPCPEWANKKHWNTDVLPIKLSRVEKTRFFRGLYRLQIYGNIFGPLQRQPVYREEDYDDEYGEWVDITFDLEEAWRVFFGTMTPWEFQELRCVWQYIYEQYNEPYAEVAVYFYKFKSYGLMEHIPKDQIDPLPVNTWVLDADELSGTSFRHQPPLANMGPAFFYKFMSKSDFRHRRDLILVNTRFPLQYFPDIWPHYEDVDEEFPLPLLYPADWFDLGVNLESTKRLWAKLPPSEGPNHAFIALWMLNSWGSWDPGTLESMYWPDGGAASDHWQWAYAIWDYERLIEWKAPLRALNGASLCQLY